MAVGQQPSTVEGWEFGLVSVVIPALNEEKSIRAAVHTVVRAAKSANDTPLDVILINDGSSDGTAAICNQLAHEYPFIQVVHHATNLGIGASILDGIRLAKHDRLTMFPGDDAVASYTLWNMLSNQDRADYVLATIINTEYRSAGRVFLSAIYTLVYTTTFGLPIKYINAPGLWPVALLKKMTLRSPRYSLHAEINVKLLRQPISFLEVDGYMSPTRIKSSAVRLKNLFEVAWCYLLICYEVFATRRNEYSFRAKRVLPAGVESVE
jgi:glycosyltransferase involved in cell wall biosynthesis